ncbi:hypothetical protein ACFDR9_003374 [Janthinobacterium sp. CG_23.3]
MTSLSKPNTYSPPSMPTRVTISSRMCWHEWRGGGQPAK